MVSPKQARTGISSCGISGRAYDAHAANTDSTTGRATFSTGKNIKSNRKQIEKMHPDDFEALLRVYEDENPTIYAITPTHTRPVQKAELTRLSQTFLHVPKFHWIVVEDSAVKTDLVTNLLRTCGLSHTHLNAMTPPDYKLQDEDPNWLKPRGVVQRNAALEWIRQELRPNQYKGVVYFADDDNTYSLELFEEVFFQLLLVRFTPFFHE